MEILNGRKNEIERLKIEIILLKACIKSLIKQIVKNDIIVNSTEFEGILLALEYSEVEYLD